jgi:hypothetical protein
VVRGEDINVREHIGAVEEFGRGAEVGHWFPDKEGFGMIRRKGFPTMKNRCYEVNAASRCTY